MKKSILVFWLCALGSMTLSAQEESSAEVLSPFTPQFVEAAGILDNVRGHLELDGRRLSENEVFQLVGQDGLNEYQSAYRQRRMGQAFIGVGAPLYAAGAGLMVYGLIGYIGGTMAVVCTAVAGALVLGFARADTGAAGGNDENSGDTDNRMNAMLEEDLATLHKAMGSFMLGGLASVAAGGAFLGVGISSMIKGNRRIDHIAEGYNEANGYDPTLSFGVTPTGVGLALRF